MGRLFSLLCIALALSACQSTMGYQETWQKAALHVSDPGVRFMHQVKPSTHLERRPTVLYMHGCSGIGFEDTAWMDYLQDLGYTVIAPDSYERPGGRVGCGGTIPERVTLRHEELNLAIEKMRELPWVDMNNLFLMGFSEGGHTLTTFADPPPGVLGIVLVGVDCAASGGSPAAPANIPVLNIVGDHDEYGFGRGCKLKRKAPGTEVYVVENGHHVGLAVLPGPRDTLRKFLEAGERTVAK